MNLPSFSRRREKERPIKFVTPAEAFQPQVEVIAKKDLSGWVDRRRRVKWHIGAGSRGFMDEPSAREFQAKGFVEVIAGEVRPVSPGELEEFLSQVTTINLGGRSG